MPIQKSEAIVLRRQPLRETSLILTFYTKDLGKIKGILRGVRGTRGQYGGGSFEILSHDELIFYDRKNSDRHEDRNFASKSQSSPQHDERNESDTRDRVKCIDEWI